MMKQRIKEPEGMTIKDLKTGYKKGVIRIW